MQYEVHTAPANAGELIGYSLYSGHLKYPQNTRQRITITALSLLA